MKHSVQFAQREETPEYYSATQEAAEAAPGSAQNPFHRRDPADARAPAPPEAGALSIDDLVGELEAALMADLHSVSSLLEPPTAEAGLLAQPDVPAPYEDEETVDAEALQRLMSSIRQPAPKARPEQTVEERSVRPRSPVAKAQADGSGMRRAGPRSVERREPPGRRLQSSLIVGAALVALAGGGAFVTVQSVTAHDNAEPASVVPAAAPVSALAPLAKQDAAPMSEAEATAPAAAAAKAEDRAPSEPSAPLSVAAADSEPAAALQSNPRGDLDPLGETATNSTLAAPAAAGMADAAVAAPPATPAPERLASADPAATAPEATPAPVKRSLGTIAAGPAKIASGVKLRSNPDNGAPVVGLLNAGTSVTVVGCKGWCEVVAGDKRGFVFQRFLAQGGAG